MHTKSHGEFIIKEAVKRLNFAGALITNVANPSHIYSTQSNKVVYTVADLKANLKSIEVEVALEAPEHSIVVATRTK